MYVFHTVKYESVYTEQFVLWLKMTRNSNSSKNKWYYRGTKMFRERPIHVQAD